MLGEVIHGYRIDQALSGDKGGFGDVFFATHVDSGAEAVVKVLKPEMSAQRDIVARFFNEARAAASIHHPGVVQIHNVGYHGDRAYLLMERLRGDDLEGRLASGPLPLDRAILFMRQAAGAIGAAHERGIVHRDLKPANLFVVADPDVVGGERVKVLDFGIAKLTVDAGAGKTQGVFGTPAYMSPEQCASTGAVDPRADLYSLGCIFYELVCGRPPFGQGGIELIASHLRDTPPPPRAIAPWLPPAVEQVILALLEKQPARRPPSCAALIAALDEAAAASGMAGGASMPMMQAAGASGARTGAPPTGPWVAPHATTLGSAAGSVSSSSMVAPARRSLGAWLGAGAVVIVAAVVAIVMVLPARSPAGGGGSGSDGSNSGSGSAASLAAGSGAGSGAVAGLVDAGAGDAGVVAVAAIVDAGAGDAAVVAADPVDAEAAAADHGDLPLEATARRLDERGRQRMRAGDHEQARQLFSQAIARVPRPAYFLDLAAADVQLGHDIAAADALREVLRRSPTPAQESRARDMLATIARDAEPKADAPTPPSGKQEPPRASLSQAELAARLNEDGKNLMYAAKYEEAARKFEEAAARVAEAKYLLNLCVAQLQSGRLGEALTACRGAESNQPTAAQQDKVNRLIGKIRDEAKRNNIDLGGR